MPNPLNWYALSGTYADISTASSLYFAVPEDGWLRGVDLTLLNAITGSDSVVTIKINGTAQSKTMTIAVSGSAAYTKFTQGYFAPVKRGDLIEVASGGESSTTCITPCVVTFSG